MKGTCVLPALLLQVHELAHSQQVSPVLSFTGSPLVRPTPSRGSSSTTNVASTTARAFDVHGANRAGLFLPAFTQGKQGRDEWAMSAGRADDVKKKPTKAAEQSAGGGGTGLWDWGFKSTPSKTVEKSKPTFSATDEAAEIEAVKLKAAAEIEAEQAQAKEKKTGKAAAVMDAARKAADAEADEIAEVKRRAAAEIEAEQEAAKTKKQEEEAKLAEEIAERVRRNKRAEELAAMARSGKPKKAPSPASKKPDPKAGPAEAEPFKAGGRSTVDGPVTLEPAVVAAAASPPAKKRGGQGVGGWDWGFKPASTTTATAKPAAAPAEVELEKPKPKVAQETQEKQAAAAKEETAAATGAAKGEAETKEAQATATRAAREKRAEELSAKARGDEPKPKKAAAAKEGKASANAGAKDVETKDVSKKKTTNEATKKGGSTRNADPASSLVLTKPETIVVVTGATGRVGSLAVRRLLELYPNVLVRAIVNDFAKGSRLLKEEKDKYGIKLEIVAAQLRGMRSAAKGVEGASAVVFCASGFAQNLSPIQRLANAVRLTINPSSVADVEGVRDVALALKDTKKIVSRSSKAAAQQAKTAAKEGLDEPQPLCPNGPRFVLLSSAAVTRPNWSPEEKALYPLAADVPIVKLNPLNILTVKAEGETELRKVGIPYTVVRPCGLNDDHPKGRPLLSVGDTAAGRICREDVADVLVRCLGTPEATGKTFEVQSLPGFEKVPASAKSNNKGVIDQALSTLPTDEALENDPELLKSIRRFTYPVLTQLRPVPLAQMPQKEE